MRACLALFLTGVVFMVQPAFAQEVLEQPALEDATAEKDTQEATEKEAEKAQGDVKQEPVKAAEEAVQKVQTEKPATTKVEEKKSSACDAISGKKVEPVKNVFAEPEKKQSLRDKVRAKLKE